MSTSIAAPVPRGRRAVQTRCLAQAQNRHYSDACARIDVILGPTRSWLSRTARIRCERELYRPSSAQKPRYVFSGVLPDGTVTSRRRGRETHRHDYTRPPASLGDELGGLSTSLGLFASISLILSTESVVVMERKGMSTSIATREASPRQTLRRCRSQARNRHYVGP